MSVTSVQIIDMFQTAYDTDKKLPAVYKKGAKAMKFEVIHDKSDQAAWSKNEIRIAASSNELRIYEYCLFYLNPLMSVDERKLVWARCYGAPWHWIGKNILKCSRHTAKKRYMGIIRLLRMRICIDEKLLAKLPRI